MDNIPCHSSKFHVQSYSFSFSLHKTLGEEYTGSSQDKINEVLTEMYSGLIWTFLVQNVSKMDGKAVSSA